MKSILRSALMLSIAGTTALAQDGGAGTGWIPVLELRVMSSLPQGATANASGDLKLVPAERAGATVWTGASLCSIGMGGGDPPSASARNNVWKVTAEYLGEQAGRHQVRVTAGFTRLSGRESSASTTQSLSLREGDGLVLDALSGPVDSSCPAHTVTMDARLVMHATDPALAHALCGRPLAGPYPSRGSGAARTPRDQRRRLERGAVQFQPSGLPGSAPRPAAR